MKILHVLNPNARAHNGDAFWTIVEDTMSGVNMDWLTTHNVHMNIESRVKEIMSNITMPMYLKLNKIAYHR